jgi:hypothetical protein
MTPTTVPDSHRLARAFLALGDAEEAETLQRSPTRVALALLAALALAVAMPLTWMAPAARSPAKAADQPAATLGTWKAVHDEDDAAA